MALRLRRSELSVPASSIKMMEKAIASDADLVFLDLEDAVAPAQKEASRKNVIEWDPLESTCRHASLSIL